MAEWGFMHQGKLLWTGFRTVNKERDAMAVADEGTCDRHAAVTESDQSVPSTQIVECADPEDFDFLHSEAPTKKISPSRTASFV
jgi:hypothetical protein